MPGMDPTPHTDAPPTRGADSSQATRNAARRRIVRITRATAAAAALTTGVVTVLAATGAQPAATASSPSADTLATVTATATADATDNGFSQTLSPSTDAPTTSEEAPVASSGGS
jgi:hypothetical protein